MSDTKSNNNYAVCIKTSEFLVEVDKMVRRRLVAGDLVQIHEKCDTDFDRCKIRLYDRETQCFETALYRCEKENLSEIPSNKWPFVHGITEGSVVKVRMALTGEQEVIVNFHVKFFSGIPPGGDQFYGLEIMPTPNLTEEHIMELNKIYLSPTLSLTLMRADNLILNLVTNEDEPRHVVPDTNLIVIDFKAQSNISLQSDEQFIIPNSIQQKVSSLTPNLSNRGTSTNLKSPNMKLFILPKVTDDEDSCTTERNCFICGKNEAALIQFNCQHIFCSECLVISFSALNDQYCPYKSDDYQCRYKITVDDLQNILNISKRKLIETPNSSKSEPNFHQCSDCQFITKNVGKRGSDECTNCKSLDLQNKIVYKETRSRDQPTKTVTPSPINTVATIETWTCIYCTYNENRIDTIRCEICDGKNDELSRKQKTTEYDKLRELEINDTFMPNFNQFYCVFCDQTIAPDNGVTLRSCLHNICLKCIVSYIERQDQIEIKCPHSMCTDLLEIREIKSFITQESYAKRLENLLNIGKMNLENGFQCCVPGCRGFWVCEDVNVKYVCPICNTENCVPCKASHPGIECSVFKAQPKP